MLNSRLVVLKKLLAARDLPFCFLLRRPLGFFITRPYPEHSSLSVIPTYSLAVLTPLMMKSLVNGPQLTADLYAQILSFVLKPPASWLRVSKTFYDILGPRLYRTLKIGRNHSSPFDYRSTSLDLVPPHRSSNANPLLKNVRIIKILDSQVSFPPTNGLHLPRLETINYLLGYDGDQKREPIPPCNNIVIRNFPLYHLVREIEENIRIEPPYLPDTVSRIVLLCGALFAFPTQINAFFPTDFRPLISSFP